jgi:hypothetical protein
MNICIQDPTTQKWTSSVRSNGHFTPAIRDAYVQYKERPHYYQETPCITDEYIVYRPDNDPYFPTYITRLEHIPREIIHDWTGVIVISQEIHRSMENASTNPIQIMDLNDVSVFIVDNPAMSRANWLAAREYQAWAYRDFMYDPHRSVKKSYMSRGTLPTAYQWNDRVLANQIVTIDIPNLPSNIVFHISRNENHSVYFERNDDYRTRVRICDNEPARAGYLGFYTRLTMDPGMIVLPPSSSLAADSTHNHNHNHVFLLSTAHLPDPEETNDEEHQCILCFKFRVNARFSPCEHTICCSGCYSKLAKNECPVCRATITRVMNM